MSKYNNRPAEIDGLRFDSQAEARHYQTLRLRQAAGEIEGLRTQVRFPLEVNGVTVATYVADFTYREFGRSEMVVADVKGMRTPVYRLKRKLMLACHGIDVLEVEA